MISKNLASATESPPLNSSAADIRGDDGKLPTDCDIACIVRILPYPQYLAAFLVLGGVTDARPVFTGSAFNGSINEATDTVEIVGLECNGLLPPTPNVVVDAVVGLSDKGWAL